MSMLRELEKLLSEIAQQQGAPPRQRPPAGQPPATSPSVEAEIVEAEPVPRETARDRRAAPAQTAKPAAPPPSKPAGGHARFDEQVKQRDAAAQSDDQTPQDAPLAADQIAELFRDVTNIRQAIVMNEILNRPVDRWR